MRRIIAAIAITLALLAYHTEAHACRTQFITVDGRLWICTVCGSLSSCVPT